MSQNDVNRIFKALEDIEYVSAADTLTKSKKLSTDFNRIIRYIKKNIPNSNSLKIISGIQTHRSSNKNQ